MHTTRYPALSLKIVRFEGAAKQTPIQAALIGMAKAARSQVGYSKVSGKVNPLRYGRLLEPHKLVGLQGAGPAYDGLHYVEKVTTNFAEGEISQDFELTRNGVLSTLPKVAA